MNNKYMTGLLIAALIVILSSATLIKNELSPFAWKDGMLNGKFHIKTATGSLEGDYNLNQRTGNWKLYDEEGELIQQRKYLNNYEYFLIDNDESTKSIYALERGPNNLYKYFPLNEDIILQSKRIWQVIDNRNFKYMFAFYRGLGQIDQLKTDIYTSSDLNHKHIKQKGKPIDLSSPSSIKILGDWFYDSKRNLSEFRLLAICPIYERTDEEYWFYYPDIRNTFGQLMIDTDNRMIESLDDLFFLGAYPYLIYKEENINNTAFEDKDLKIPTEAVLNELLQTEVKLWIKK